MVTELVKNKKDKEKKKRLLGGLLRSGDMLVERVEVMKNKKLYEDVDIRVNLSKASMALKAFCASLHYAFQL